MMISKKQTNDNSLFQFIDNRPQTSGQRKLQKVANSGSQNMHTKQLQMITHSQVLNTIQRRQLLKGPGPFKTKFENRQKRKNQTGLPDTLKTGIEYLSGYSMDEVKEHYNSDNSTHLQSGTMVQQTDFPSVRDREKRLMQEDQHVA